MYYQFITNGLSYVYWRPEGYTEEHTSWNVQQQIHVDIFGKG